MGKMEPFEPDLRPLADPQRLLDRWEIQLRNQSSDGAWHQDVFGLWLPPTIETSKVQIRQRWRFQIRQDGVDVYDDQLGGWREADWREAAQIRSGWIDAIGPELARAAGIEPE